MSESLRRPPNRRGIVSPGRGGYTNRTPTDPEARLSGSQVTLSDRLDTLTATLQTGATPSRIAARSGREPRRTARRAKIRPVPRLGEAVGTDRRKVPGGVEIPGDFRRSGFHDLAVAAVLLRQRRRFFVGLAAVRGPCTGRRRGTAGWRRLTAGRLRLAASRRRRRGTASWRRGRGTATRRRGTRSRLTASRLATSARCRCGCRRFFFTAEHPGEEPTFPVLLVMQAIEQPGLRVTRSGQNKRRSKCQQCHTFHQKTPRYSNGFETESRNLFQH